MPLYVYRNVKTGEIIELIHAATGSLKTHPETGEALQRVYTPLAVGRSDKAELSNKNLAQHGFSKLVKEGPGKYRKVN